MVTSKLPLRSTSNRVVSFLQILYYLIEGILLSLIPESWRYKDIKGQTVLITGPGSGIGQLMAVKFAQLGCKLVLWDVNEEGMKQTVKMVKEVKVDAKCWIFKVDLSKREEIYEVARKVKQEVGVVDILVNNAGVVSGGFLLDIPDEKNKLTFDVNALAHFWTVKSFLPDMIRQKRGHIVTVASVAGNMVSPRMTDYCASKHANVGFDLSLRMELAQASLDGFIKTTIVKPYLITTGMFDGCQPFLFSALEPDYVARRAVSGVLANSKEVVLPRAICFLFFLFNVIPSKCIKPAMDLGGLLDLMANFQGRHPEMDKPRIHEINNNVDGVGLKKVK